MENIITETVKKDQRTNENIMTLDESMDHLYRTLYQYKLQEDDQKATPYFFLVGAGISRPEIDGSRGIIDACKKQVAEMYTDDLDKIESIEKEAEEHKSNTMSEYSFWFKIAYPNRKERENYLKSIIQKAKISSSNLLLAQILSSKKIANTVLTPNFDDKLLQALSLFGIYDVFVADNPQDNLAISSSSDLIQIAHIHGTYHFYNSCNTFEEILSVKGNSGRLSVTNILDEFFKHKTPIVIGYSGWEEDVIMSRLHDSLAAPLGHIILWYCYDKESYLNLPDWLKESDSVKFILPKESLDCSADLMIENDLEEIKVDFDEHDTEADGNKLYASDVLNALISKFDIERPDLFSNPFRYYSKIMDSYIPEDNNVYFLRNWVNRMRYIEKDLEKDSIVIKKFVDAAHRNNSVKMAEAIHELSTSQLSDLNYFYILIDIIYPRIKNEYDINNNDFYNFIIGVIDFLGKQVASSKNITEETIRVLRALLFNVKADCDHIKHLNIIDEILKISDGFKELDILSIRAKGIKGDLLPIDERRDILSEILLDAIKHEDDPEVAFLQCTIISRMLDIALDVAEKQKLLNILIGISDKHPDDQPIQTKVVQIRLQILESLPYSSEMYKKYIESILKLDGERHTRYLFRAYYNMLLNTNNRKMQLKLYNEVIVFQEKIDSEDCEAILYYCRILHYYIDKLETDGNIDDIRDMCYKIIDELSVKDCLSYKVEMVKAYMRLHDISSSETEKKEYNLKIIEICRPVKGEKLFIQFSLGAAETLCSMLLDSEKTEFIEENTWYKNYIKAVDLLNLAVESFKNNNLKESQEFCAESYNLFEETFDGNFNQTVINLAFLKRKDATYFPEISVKELLYKDTTMDPFRYINLALWYITGEEVSDWQAAIEEVNKIEMSDRFNRAVEFWKNIEYVGEDESTIALILLLNSGKINFDDIGIPKDVLKQRCKNLEIPTNILHKLFPSDIE